MTSGVGCPHGSSHVMVMDSQINSLASAQPFCCVSRYGAEEGTYRIIGRIGDDQLPLTISALYPRYRGLEKAVTARVPRPDWPSVESVTSNHDERSRQTKPEFNLPIRTEPTAISGRQRPRIPACVPCQGEIPYCWHYAPDLF